MASDLRRLMDEHMGMPFPESVDKGLVYGEVDAVMIGADIFGWAARIESGETLNTIERKRFKVAASELSRSITAFPPPARPYYELVLRLATVALSE